MFFNQNDRSIIKPLLLTVLTIVVLFSLYGWIEHYWLTHAPERLTNFLHILRGVGTALIVGLLVSWYFMNQKPFTEGTSESSYTIQSDQERNRERLVSYTRWFIHLRWLAILAVFASILAGQATGILPPETVPLLFVELSLLALSNLIYYGWFRRYRNYRTQLVTQMITDLCLLTALLHCSGGLENPIFLIYIFHVILAGILFSARTAWYFTGLTSLLFLFLGVSELTGFLPHYTVEIFPHEVSEHGMEHASQNINFVAGRMGAFLSVMLCTTFFVTMLMKRLRQHENELARTAREARANQQRIETIVRAAELGIVYLKSDCRVDWFNSLLEDWFNWDSEAVGNSCPFEVEDNEGKQYCVAEETLSDGKTTRHEVSVENDHERTYYITTTPVTNEKGKTEAVQIIQDVTEQKVMEAEVSHAGKMKILGRLAAGIAHEIGNPLNSLKTRLHRMKREDNPNLLQKNLDFIEEQLNRIGEIVHEISQFSGRKSVEWELVDLNGIVRQTLDVIKMDDRSSDVQFDLDLDESLPRTAGVYNQLEQVCLNFLLNATEAVENKNEATIRLRTDSTRNIIQLSIEDSGPGIPPEERDRVFNAFYTTREKGTGLGLAICESIVEAHNGQIKVNDSPLGGAKFTMEIPLRQETAPPVKTGELTRGPSEFIGQPGSNREETTA